MWSGWPTFPQVYVKGTLIGGFSETTKELADGSLKKRLG
jgi:glutaredoxin-related protein